MKARTIYQLFASCLIFSTCAWANPDSMTEFADLEDLKHRSSLLEKPDRHEERWFERDSNYGRLFLADQGRQLIVTWLGMNSAEYKVESFDQLQQRSFCGVRAYYRSKRYDEPPFILTTLIPHPRSLSSRTMNLIPEFTDLEKKVSESYNSEKIRISGIEATLGLNPEKENCRLIVPIARQGILFIEVATCTDGKKLIQFAETIDIIRLNSKLEK